LEELASDNPQLPVLRQRTALLAGEIEAETMRVAGATGESLAGKASQYQRFLLEREFADKMLASAMNSLERARNEAQRKQLYLERIAQPNLPDAAMEPKRLRAVLAVFVLGLIGWGILTMLIAGIKEHQD
jgi:capsular polysaccharide transport system permease protein